MKRCNFCVSAFARNVRVGYHRPCKPCCVCTSFQASKPPRKSLPETNETNVDVSVTSSVYVSTPCARQVSRQRPASIQLLDHYEQIPADVTSPPLSARRHASFDDLRLRPQPPIPGDCQGQRSRSEVSADRCVVDSMTRKPSYDENEVILIDSAIYG